MVVRLQWMVWAHLLVRHCGLPQFTLYFFQARLGYDYVGAYQNQHLTEYQILPLYSKIILGVQRAGFEPANQYGLGPHPSAFDQAGQPLRV